MKLNFELNKESLANVTSWLSKTWSVVAIVVVSVIFLTLSTIALYPRVDQESVKAGTAKIEALNIRFDTKLLDELSATKTPSELKASGGRDPFAGY